MHKSARFIIGILASVLFLAGCGNSPSPLLSASPSTTQSSTTQADATQPATTALGQTFTSTDGVYTFQYPTGWTTQAYTTSPVTNGEIVVSPDTTDYFVVLPLSEDVSAQASTVFSSFLTGFGGSDINATAQSDVTVGANTWTEYVSTFTKSGTAYDAAEFSIVHNGNSVLVIGMAPHATSSDDGTKYFQPMLTSLTFQQ